MSRRFVNRDGATRPQCFRRGDGGEEAGRPTPHDDHARLLRHPGTLRGSEAESKRKKKRRSKDRRFGKIAAAGCDPRRLVTPTPDKC
jgi:hypothetical protein